VGIEFTPSSIIPVQDPALARLYSYWNEKRGDRPFPSRAEIDPLDLHYILGWLMLIDVSHDPVRFRFRLYGSNLVDQMGFDVTGRDLADHPHAEFRHRVEEQWRATVEARCATHAAVDAWIDGRRLRYESLRLPLSTDGTIIDMLLVAVIHLDIKDVA
jgi:hypothetical protein